MPAGYDRRGNKIEETKEEDLTPRQKAIKEMGTTRPQPLSVLIKELGKKLKCGAKNNSASKLLTKGKEK